MTLPESLAGEIDSLCESVFSAYPNVVFVGKSLDAECAAMSKARSDLEAAIERYVVERIGDALHDMRLKVVGIYGDVADKARDYVHDHMFQLRAIAGIPQPRVKEIGGTQ